MIYIVSLLFVSLFSLVETDRNKNNMFTVEVKENYSDEIVANFTNNKLRLLYKITPSVYIFKYEGREHEVLEYVRNTFPDLVVDIEPIKVYNNTFKQRYSQHDDGKPISSENLVCSNYYGMDVSKVWKQNITGKGVIIAVNDVGIDADLYDLKRNSGNCSLCMNFMANNTDIEPESFDEYFDKTPGLVDHGNKIASIVAAEKYNNFCSAGIAYDATIVALKVYEITLDGNSLSLNTSSDVISRSFIHVPNEIDIFINALTIDMPFEKLELSTKRAIDYGATKGRNGLGTIYVVSAGYVGNGLSHNIFTISVSSIGIRGSLPAGTILDSSVLISGIHSGNNITSSSMVTTSRGNNCVRNFSGVSAAVSQISGIIALGLQANPNLTLRDVQHNLVKAADVERLEQTRAFKTNGASLRFHDNFGFGLLNADKFVKLAVKKITTPPLLSRNLSEYKRSTGFRTQDFEFSYNCDNECLTTLEHVMVSINFSTDTEKLRVEITSPSDTVSTIMDMVFDKEEIPYSNEGNIVTVHFWDESPQGNWNVKIINRKSGDKTDVYDISLTFYGTGQNGDHGEREETDSSEGTDWKKLYFLFFLSIIPCVISLVVYKYRKRNGREEEGSSPESINMM